MHDAGGGILNSRNFDMAAISKSAQSKSSGPITVAKLGNNDGDIIRPTLLKDGGDTSSNYDASIFEDEDGDSSSDNMDDSGKDSARRSLGADQVQEPGTVHLGTKLLEEPEKKFNGKSIFSLN